MGDVPDLHAKLSCSALHHGWYYHAGCTALHVVARIGLLHVCQALVAQPNFGVTAMNDADADGWTALHYAAFRGHTAICELILNHPSFDAIDATTRRQSTARDLALRQGHYETADAIDAFTRSKAGTPFSCGTFRNEEPGEDTSVPHL